MRNVVGIGVDVFDDVCRGTGEEISGADTVL